jgi:hypothetical protein
MSAVGVGVAWALITIASFAALSASALARSRHDLEVAPGGLPTSMRWPAGEHAQWPAIEVAPTSPVLRSSPSVTRLHSLPSRFEPVLLS